MIKKEEKKKVIMRRHQTFRQTKTLYFEHKSNEEGQNDSK